MSDLIRREDVYDVLKKVNISEMPIYVFDKLWKGIRNLPSAESERIAKMIEHDASVTDTDGYIYHRSEYLCGACKKKVLGGDEYCSHCGVKLDWSE